jgi:hypothetical protein
MDAPSSFIFKPASRRRPSVNKRPHRCEPAPAHRYNLVQTLLASTGPVTML